MPTMRSSRVMSEDGTRAFFSTGERLVAADADHSGDICYVRDLESGTTSLVSAGAARLCPRMRQRARMTRGSRPRPVDGDEIFFVTTEWMAPADEDDAVDVYERDLSEGSTTLVSAGAAECAPGCGNGSLTATLRGVSADGSRAFFATFEALCGGGRRLGDRHLRARPSHRADGARHRRGVRLRARLRQRRRRRGLRRQLGRRRRDLLRNERGSRPR